MGHHPFRTLAPRIAHRSYPPRRQPWHSILQSTFREKKQRGMERAGASESETQCPVICMYGQAQVNPALAVVPMVVDTSRPPKVGCRTNRRYICINERLPKKEEWRLVSCTRAEAGDVDSFALPNHGTRGHDVQHEHSTSTTAHDRHMTVAQPRVPNQRHRPDDLRTVLYWTVL